jgi:hypothetical protein
MQFTTIGSRNDDNHTAAEPLPPEPPKRNEVLEALQQISAQLSELTAALTKPAEVAEEEPPPTPEPKEELTSEDAE